MKKKTESLSSNGVKNHENNSNFKLCSSSHSFNVYGNKRIECSKVLVALTLLIDIFKILSCLSKLKISSNKKAVVQLQGF